jgi:hypothetical protein
MFGFGMHRNVHSLGKIAHAQHCPTINDYYEYYNSTLFRFRINVKMKGLPSQKHFFYLFIGSEHVSA